MTYHSPLESMVANTQKMKAFAEQLKPLGVDHFSVLRTTSNNMICNLSSIDGWIQKYYKDKLYKTSSFEACPLNYQNSIYLLNDNCGREVIKTGNDNFNSYNCMVIVIRSLYDVSHYFFSKKMENIQPVDDRFNKIKEFYDFLIEFKACSADMFESSQVPRKTLYETEYAQSVLRKFSDEKENNMLLERGDNYLETCRSFYPFSLKEEKVLACLLKGLSAKEIANQFFVSPRTIETHIENIKEKSNHRKTVTLLATLYKEHYRYALALVEHH